jgi:diguanylate cyclase (GGDEF)-like protein
VAACLQAQHRPQDLLGQIGDQAFAMVMVDVDQAAAMERAEAIRTGIAELGGVFRASGHQLSVSGGLTLLAPDEGCPQELLLRAERALFLAQGNGHNQIALLLEDR